ncbi:DUF397 domain-containing protein [Streptomyces sp. 3MP-14]|uniref:DUF397 domain-containing protein n=1 Tax=Streptomyces mimosae TaxID=2586635 RepID=A0A5N6A154_9ACTN|nr:MULTISPECIES: DUF397 domain-containing protein [Streptomyces]KAB8161803.1 DUF397 domain-containing protein [Streptomyces mimosae]KAB8174929.1 DUF397 domain-containing protein [Streptomyces sp. 3MP-14]
MNCASPVVPNWRTSTHTKSDSCVEVADNDVREVRVRDTKARARGTVTARRDAWGAFVEYAKRAPGAGS